MTTQSQNNRDSELFCISQNAVIEAPSQPARSCCESLRMASVRQSDKRQPDGCPTESVAKSHIGTERHRNKQLVATTGVVSSSRPPCAVTSGPGNRRKETATSKRGSHRRSSASVKKPACKSDKNRRSQRATNESNDESNHYAVSGAVNSKFQLVYDVIQLDRGKESQLTSSASAINSNVIVTPASAAPCDKHPPEYFAQLLLEKQQQKSKLNQLWPKHWGSYNDQPERDSLDGDLPSSSIDPSKSNRSLKEKEAEATGLSTSSIDTPDFNPPLSPRSMAGNKSIAPSTKSVMKSANWTGEREPFTHLWVSLSSMYGKLLVVLMLAFCFTEVMDNSIAPLTFQGVFMIYLYVGSIVAIMCIYISLLIDQCPSLTKSRENLTGVDAETGSVGSFDTLKRAHISRAQTPRTSFYLRVGALVFGLATLIFNGLEIAMHSTMEGKCVAEIVFAHPILQALFTFLQMHFLFVNSEVLVEKFGLLARFGFMHLIATNVSLWIRTVVWESANEWLHYLHHQRLHHGAGLGAEVGVIAQRQFSGRNGGYMPSADYAYFDDEADFPAANNIDYITASVGGPSSLSSNCNSTFEFITTTHIQNMVGLYECFNNNTLGKMWATSMPYLFPFLVEYKLKLELHFSLIAAAVAYIMWRSVGQLKKNGVFQSRLHKQLTSVPDDINNTLDPHRPKGHWRVDCQGASKGLFLGLLSLVAGIIVLIIFFVMKDNVDFRPDLFWLCTGTQVTVLALATVFNAIGFIQLPKLSLSLHKPLHLDVLLANITTYGVFIYAIFGLIVGGTNLSDQKHVMIFVSNGLLLIQATMQGMFIAEASKRVCTSRYQMLFKPGRQIVTFLLFANITLWLLDTFMTHNWMTQELQFSFYGFLAWGIISRLALPLLVFYRFHSAVVLIEIWKNTYRTKDV
ncbi:proton channel OtopLc isoform X1 [Daphnia magna]|uniref:proton channel OtopLc isoform X1 n=1 Tax=Daphnia magna TaxID=35525 RepID=UPI001E1BCFE3|nr:proton channel OtopLc isoform X1 [Daphnia magna]